MGDLGERAVRMVEAWEIEGLVSLYHGLRAPGRKEVGRAILTRFRDEPARLYRLGRELAGRPEMMARFNACRFIHLMYGTHPEETLGYMVALANDECWEVREAAVHPVSSLLIERFDEVYPVFREWTRDPRANIRRVVVVAAMSVARVKSLAPRIHEIIALLEPLLADRTAYVRKNLGPFAIGSGIGWRFPDLTFDYLSRWAQDRDDQVRWNAAMAVSASFGARHPERSVMFLRTLGADPSGYVRGACFSALRQLARRRTAEVVPLLRDWLADEELREVAQRVLEAASPRSAGLTGAPDGRQPRPR